jgi:hypothetical protein
VKCILVVCVWLWMELLYLPALCEMCWLREWWVGEGHHVVMIVGLGVDIIGRGMLGYDGVSIGGYVWNAIIRENAMLGSMGG